MKTHYKAFSLLLNTKCGFLAGIALRFALAQWHVNAFVVF